MAKIYMEMSGKSKEYYLPAMGETINVKRGQEFNDDSTVGKQLVEHYPYDVIRDGVSVLDSLASGDIGGTGGVDLTPDGLTSTQAKYAIYKAHSISSSASKIDGKITQDRQTLVLLGDSITAGNSVTSQGTIIPYRTNIEGQVVWGNYLSGYKFDIVANLGIGGETSTQILARVQSVIDINPSHCIVLCGMNDPAGEVANQLLIDNIKAIYESLSNAGIFVFFCTPTTRVGDTQKNSQSLRARAFMMSYFSTKPNIEIIDLCSAWIDSSSLTALPVLSNLRDDLHPSIIGGYTGGKEISKTFSKFKTKYNFPISAYDDYNITDRCTQLLKNPMMIGTGGNNAGAVTGTVAKDHNVYIIQAGTCNCSKEARSDGFGEYQVFDITGSALNSNIRHEARSNYIPIIGDKVYAEAEIVIENCTNFEAVRLFLLVSNTTVSSVFANESADNISNFNTTTPISLTYRTPIYTVTSTGTNILVRNEMIFNNAGSARIKIGRVSVRRVIE